MRWSGPMTAASRRLSEGVSTVDWPFERLAREGPPRGTPAFDAATCTRCGECVTACTARCLALEKGDGSGAGLPIVDAGACVRCGICVAECPEGAVALTGPTEVAAYGRDDLRLHPGEPPAEQAVGPSPSGLSRRAVASSSSSDRTIGPGELLARRLGPLQDRTRARARRRKGQARADAPVVDATKMP